MKKPLFLILLCLSLCACEVRHNHNKQMMQVRVADDTPTQNDTTPLVFQQLVKEVV